MTPKQLNDLNEGDIIRHKLHGESVVVTGNYGMHVTAVRTCDVTNAEEWDLISKHHFKRIYPENKDA